MRGKRETTRPFQLPEMIKWYSGCTSGYQLHRSSVWGAPVSITLMSLTDCILGRLGGGGGAEEGWSAWCLGMEGRGGRGGAGGGWPGRLGEVKWSVARPR